MDSTCGKCTLLAVPIICRQPHLQSSTSATYLIKWVALLCLATVRVPKSHFMTASTNTIMNIQPCTVSVSIDSRSVNISPYSYMCYPYIERYIGTEVY